MAVIQRHHIIYDDTLPEGGWVVELNALQHKTITAIQRTNSTEQAYADLTNYVHAVMEEWQRMRMELDTKSRNSGN